MTFGRDQCPSCGEAGHVATTLTVFGGTVRTCGACGYPLAFLDPPGTHPTILDPTNAPTEAKR